MKKSLCDGKLVFMVSLILRRRAGVSANHAQQVATSNLYATFRNQTLLSTIEEIIEFLSTQHRWNLCIRNYFIAREVWILFVKGSKLDEFRLDGPHIALNMIVNFNDLNQHKKLCQFREKTLNECLGPSGIMCNENCKLGIIKSKRKFPKDNSHVLRCVQQLDSS